MMQLELLKPSPQRSIMSVNQKNEPPIHKLKIKDEYLKDLLSGKKVFEIRFNDRNYKVGEFLEFEDKTHIHLFEIFYIHEGLGLQENYVCMSVGRKVTMGKSDFITWREFEKEQNAK